MSPTSVPDIEMASGHFFPNDKIRYELLESEFKLSK